MMTSQKDNYMQESEDKKLSNLEIEKKRKIEKILGTLQLKNQRVLYIGCDSLDNLLVTEDRSFVDNKEITQYELSFSGQTYAIDISSHPYLKDSIQVLTISHLTSNNPRWLKIGANKINQPDSDQSHEAIEIGGDLNTEVEEFLNAKYYPSLLINSTGASYFTVTKNGNVILFPNTSDVKINSEKMDMPLYTFFYSLTSKLFSSNLEVLTHTTELESENQDLKDAIENIIESRIPKYKVHIPVPVAAINYIKLDVISRLIKKKKEPESYERDTFDLLDSVLENYSFEEIIDRIVDENGSFTNVNLSDSEKPEIQNTVKDIDANKTSNLDIGEVNQSRSEQISKFYTKIWEVLNTNTYQQLDQEDNLLNTLKKIIKEAKKTAVGFDPKLESLEKHLSNYNASQVFDIILDEEIVTNSGIGWKFYNGVHLNTFTNIHNMTKLILIANMAFASGLFMNMINTYIDTGVVPVSFTLFSLASLLIAFSGLQAKGILDDSSENFHKKLFSWQVNIIEQVLDKVDFEKNFNIDPDFFILVNRFESLKKYLHTDPRIAREALDRTVFKKIISILKKKILSYDEAILLKGMLDQIEVSDFSKHDYGQDSLDKIVLVVNKTLADNNFSRSSSDTNRINRLTHEQKESASEADRQIDDDNTRYSNLT